MQNQAMNELPFDLQKANTILLFCHCSPDGDTLGSSLALALRLKEMGKTVSLLVPGSVPDSLSFLPGLDLLQTDPQRLHAGDLSVAVDVSSMDMLKENSELFSRSAKTAVIDHHATNPRYGMINIIDGDAPATAILIHQLLKELPGKLSREESICLYTALSTDTGNFIYDSTNAEAFEMMADLMKAGLPIGDYGRLLFREKEEPFIQLLKEALNTLHVMEDGRIAGLSLSREQMKRANASEGHRNTIVNYGIDIKGVVLAFLASETPEGKTKFSLRSKPPYDVSAFAKRLGGGGHAQASGVTVNLPLSEAIPFMENEMKKLLRDVE